MTKNTIPTSKFEFHIAADIRRKYEFEDALFSLNGNVILADFRAARALAHKMNAKRPVRDRVPPGLVNGAGLLDEIFHHLLRLYETRINPGVFGRALSALRDALGPEHADRVLLDFVVLFPPLDVVRGKLTPDGYLSGRPGDRSNAEAALEESILLFFANINPALSKIRELFDDGLFPDRALFLTAIDVVDRFFRNEPKFGPRNLDVFALFRAPILRYPGDVEAQLDDIRSNLGEWLDDLFLRRILNAKDLGKEDGLGTGGFGESPTAVPRYRGESDADEEALRLGRSGFRYASAGRKAYEENENFTSDADWMPRVVLMAKNVYVWLDQLSKLYGRPIRSLDQIPDEELDRLARWNFSGLWLIGIWERSPASRAIKRRMGNPDAVASAYSLYDYRIAADLGGEAAFENLMARARARNIRLASDMVPNHTGLYSKWIVEHPDYFIQSPRPPFPNYGFSGPDLSEDPAVQLRIEDGYWRRSDAAVVFQRIDSRSGETRYIYHGNDGTNMPWNDTAQLDMLRGDVREAVIGKILDVARRFPIIRFDAAMTLTKRHFARLWYPQPGHGGDIPSRADFALTAEEFDRAFPAEFWRDVVDRINAERPDTLLLAEAFWLMEGYFVRSLGMHRVYNSAFMHMMMREENSKFRDLLSNTLEFEPEILKRYVNFMSNPDEETAIRQFGLDDKYFGVCALMATLPGLPMFAHGQVEGLTEKYGMEYPRAYYHESPDAGLIERHEREIFPLLAKRHLFAQVDHFWLFDVLADGGAVNENVLAFTNRAGAERAIILFNNKYEHAAGRVFRSSPKLVSGPTGKNAETRTIAEALSLDPGPGRVYLFRDQVSGLEYVRAGSDLARNGFSFELGAFKRLVLLDWREIADATGEWETFARKIGGRSVPDARAAFEDAKLEPLHRAFERLFEDGIASEILTDRFAFFVSVVKERIPSAAETKPLAARFAAAVEAGRSWTRRLDDELKNLPALPFEETRRVLSGLRSAQARFYSIIVQARLIVAHLEEIVPVEGTIGRGNIADVLRLETPLRRILADSGRGGDEIDRTLSLWSALPSRHAEVAVLLGVGKKIERTGAESRDAMIALLGDDRIRAFLGANEYGGIWYYSKERFEDFLAWSLTFLGLTEGARGEPGPTAPSLKRPIEMIRVLLEASRDSEYKIEALKSNWAARQRS